MSNELPKLPLPEPAYRIGPGYGGHGYFTADQMRAYVLADRAERDFLATPFLRHVQNVAEIDSPEWGDEFLAWYKPAEWMGEHRACAVFLGMKLRAIRASGAEG